MAESVESSSQSRYEDEIMSLADSRSYVQTSRVSFDNLISSQKFTSCQELLSQSAELSTNESEFHITDTQLTECCNKAEVMMKQVNNVDAPERARGDNKNKTIVKIIFEDFSTTPFNSPTSSPERNLERSPLLYYGRNRNVAIVIDDKNDKHLLNDSIETSASNQRKTGINENYSWDEDDNDLFFSINTQEILDQNVNVNNNFPSTSKFPVNKDIIQGTQELFGSIFKINLQNELFEGDFHLLHPHLRPKYNFYYEAFLVKYLPGTHAKIYQSLQSLVKNEKDYLNELVAQQPI
uniref:Uncharacterized protein n=1 Tax=Glossina austeni TaxID=7395 RepID=A0A1A9VMD0_GLOAU